MVIGVQNSVCAGAENMIVRTSASGEKSIHCHRPLAHPNRLPDDPGITPE